jgi:hypothetical protein
MESSVTRVTWCGPTRDSWKSEEETHRRDAEDPEIRGAMKRTARNGCATVSRRARWRWGGRTYRAWWGGERWRASDVRWEGGRSDLVRPAHVEWDGEVATAEYMEV